MTKFVYVFAEDARDKLIALGYNLVKADCRQNIYVFENKQTFTFSLNEMEFVLSDTLTF